MKTLRTAAFVTASLALAGPTSFGGSPTPLTGQESAPLSNSQIVEAFAKQGIRLNLAEATKVLT